MPPSWNSSGLKMGVTVARRSTMAGRGFGSERRSVAEPRCCVSGICSGREIWGEGRHARASRARRAVPWAIAVVGSLREEGRMLGLWVCSVNWTVAVDALYRPVSRPGARLVGRAGLCLTPIGSLEEPRALSWRKWCSEKKGGGWDFSL